MSVGSEGWRGIVGQIYQYLDTVLYVFCIKLSPHGLSPLLDGFLMLFFFLEFGEGCKLIRCIRAGIMSPCRMIHKESSKLALLGIEFKARTCYSHINRYFHGA